MKMKSTKFPTGKGHVMKAGVVGRLFMQTVDSETTGSTKLEEHNLTS